MTVAPTTDTAPCKQDDGTDGTWERGTAKMPHPDGKADNYETGDETAVRRVGGQPCGD